jgi:hypothetical protein
MVELSYKRSEWEMPLSSERGQAMGFCDLYCEYSVGNFLSWQTKIAYQLNSLSVSEGSIIGKKITFSKTSEKQAWQQYATAARLFFEVKTKIPSVGELMRQLQLYKTSPTFRWSPGDGPKSINKWIVVAPPNNEAVSVCAQHAIFFVEYRNN